MVFTLKIASGSDPTAALSPVKQRLAAAGIRAHIRPPEAAAIQFRFAVLH